MIEERLAGTWQLVGFEVNYPDGKTEYPYDREPAGLLVYDRQGWMSVQIMRPGIEQFKVDDRWLGSPEEMQAAFNGYVAYYGRYTVDVKTSRVTHHVEGSVFPNYIGTKMVRLFEFQNDCLELSTPPMAFGGEAGTGRLTWVRLPDQDTD